MSFSVTHLSNLWPSRSRLLPSPPSASTSLRLFLCLHSSLPIMHVDPLYCPHPCSIYDVMFLPRLYFPAPDSGSFLPACTFVCTLQCFSWRIQSLLHLLRIAINPSVLRPPSNSPRKSWNGLFGCLIDCVQHRSTKVPSFRGGSINKVLNTSCSVASYGPWVLSWAWPL